MDLSMSLILWFNRFGMGRPLYIRAYLNLNHINWYGFGQYGMGMPEPNQTLSGKHLQPYLQNVYKTTRTEYFRDFSPLIWFGCTRTESNPLWERSLTFDKK
jgi:hypothetical protein